MKYLSRREISEAPIRYNAFFYFFIFFPSIRMRIICNNEIKLLCNFICRPMPLIRPSTLSIISRSQHLLLQLIRLSYRYYASTPSVGFNSFVYVYLMQMCVSYVEFSIFDDESSIEELSKEI